MSVHPVFLRDKRAGTTVDADLLEGITPDHLRQVDQSWKPVLSRHISGLIASGAPRADWPQSAHWNWSKKMASIGSLLAYRSFAIERSGRLEGLMIANTQKFRVRETTHTGQHMVYVDYLETAPWNRENVVPDPEFGGVGTSFLRAAIQLSRDEGFRGRIGLHSLVQSEPFYRLTGMIDFGADATKQNLTYFEMTSAAADVFMS